MRKLLVVQAALAIIAGWGLVNTQAPLDKSVNVRAQKLSPERILHEAKVAAARRSVESVLRTYGCSDRVLDSVSRAAVDYRVSPRLVAATVAVESGCRENVVSPAGAIGLMQVEPQIWHVSKERLRDPEINIRTGTRILSGHIRAYGQKEGLRRYFGITPGSDASYIYASLVEARAY